MHVAGRVHPPPLVDELCDLRTLIAMPIARLSRACDLPALLALFAASEVSLAAEPRERAERIWEETLAQPGVR